MFAVDAVGLLPAVRDLELNSTTTICGDPDGPHIRTCRSRVTYGVISDFQRPEILVRN